MKNLIVCITLATAPALISAQVSKSVESYPTHVTVFLSGAQVTREAKSSVASGRTELVLSGLPSQLEQQSIQVMAKGKVMVLAIRHQVNFLTGGNLPKKLRLWTDSLETIQRQLVLAQGQMEILGKEEQMLMSNQKIGGSSQNLTAAELKSMADFYRARLNEIVASRLKLEAQVQSLNKTIARLQQQIRAEQNLRNQNTSEIVITVEAASPTTASFEVSYVVQNAGWQPTYDIRALNSHSPLHIDYRANVFQSTGEDWKDIRLTLSTANPNLGGVKPQLYPWYLDFYQPVPMGRGADKRSREVMAPAMAKSMASEMEDEEKSVANLSDFVSTIQTSLNTEFSIDLPYSVSSTGQPTLVNIKSVDLPSQYNYEVVPKLDMDAFLVAKATGWEDIGLLPGEANLFFESTFVSKTFLDPNSIQDTLSVSLGRDKRIIVKREKLKDLTTKRLIGSNRREEYAWEISIRNTKSESIQIRVEDQIPVSKNSQIELSVVDTGGAQTDHATGKLTWNLNIPAGETRKVTFKYEVKYPKDRTITGLY